MMKNKIDYAPYYLEAKRKLQEAYDVLKVGNYEEAATLLEDAAAEVRLMKIAVKSYVE
jgi:hypothetical protein